MAIDFSAHSGDKLIGASLTLNPHRIGHCRIDNLPVNKQSFIFYFNNLTTNPNNPVEPIRATQIDLNHISKTGL